MKNNYALMQTFNLSTFNEIRIMKFEGYLNLGQHLEMRLAFLVQEK